MTKITKVEGFVIEIDEGQFKGKYLLLINPQTGNAGKKDKDWQAFEDLLDSIGEEEYIAFLE